MLTNSFNFAKHIFPQTIKYKLTTLVTRIKEVLRIAVMGGKFFHVMLPLEDMAEFMDANMVRIRVLVYQV